MGLATPTRVRVGSELLLKLAPQCSRLGLGLFFPRRTWPRYPSDSLVFLESSASEKSWRAGRISSSKSTSTSRYSSVAEAELPRVPHSAARRTESAAGAHHLTSRWGQLHPRTGLSLGKPAALSGVPPEFDPLRVRISARVVRPPNLAELLEDKAVENVRLKFKQEDPGRHEHLTAPSRCSARRRA